MERETLLGLSFFLFVLLATQEAVVQIEGCEKKSPDFVGPCVGPILSQNCDFICKHGQVALPGGSCKNGECMCVC
ncbi:putative knottin, scorpion toxin [Medicago truncatula]|uniref:Defensin-like protein n=1 Tax=Medicago truncatula TaxID=3880 RepID=A0A072TMH1_MEDTR|nr:Defensin-like protein [Medicago truncatula]RHN38864.1 putative knottin, scorpion toxin [Medicago truncatula]